jgi:hypothetical protein
LQTPVSSIIPTRNGMMARVGMIVVAIVVLASATATGGGVLSGKGGGRSAWIKTPGRPGWNHRELLVGLNKYQTLPARDCLDLVLNGGAARCPL